MLPKISSHQKKKFYLCKNASCFTELLVLPLPSRVSQRSKLPKLCALHLAMDLGGKPEEKIRSFTLPLAKIDPPAVEIRHTVVSSGTSLCLVLFLELHRALHSPGRVLLSRLMRLFVLHPTMLILAPRARTGKLTLQGFPSRWRGIEGGQGGACLTCCCRWRFGVDVHAKSLLSLY